MSSPVSAAASGAPQTTSSWSGCGRLNRRTCALSGRGADGAVPPSTTWVLIPPKPIALTEAYRSPAGQGRASSVTRSAPPSASSGWGRRQPVVGGSTSRCTASTALISPATPAAALVCPMFALMLPSTAGDAAGPRTPSSARSSASSPTAVPVPCPSTSRTAPGSMPARSYARRSASRCPLSSGRVSPPLPSDEEAQPSNRPYGRSPRSRAYPARASTTTPQPSPGRKPVGRASYTRISSPASAPTREKPTSSSGSRLRSTPPASATSSWPAATASAAVITASREEAQAPSTV
ncbi:hypothetical protein B0E53_06248 [Micromonospora sp. MH33]|nr:hypothetical protein B0E53_06248 [Micromonospora sp. MH33]